ncbi:hypothetical protein SCLCIDRAFT_1217643 [Scleroderma citrinum Foug A]|uniref:Uncharacterized protein n=1 Tax=Scleroderma citrinum Foug A TaxID=1036808 RepID=A0A0C3DTK8_9AGAM|nr:hypothetical protein SCLCIDRAFT_1217643 [Scleroderma citrinum Foug A]
MESLDLNGLAKSLPASNFEKAEKDLLNNFKAAALSITTLYRSSRSASKRAYNAGYAAACQDLMSMIQQGVSADVGIAHPLNGETLSIGRILDWTEARIEALKAREEEEDEDEEREKEKERARSGPPSTSNTATKDSAPPVSFPTKASTSYRAPENTAPLTPHSPTLTNTSVLHAHTHPPSSPSPTLTARSTQSLLLNPRPTKARLPFTSRKDLTDPTSTSTLPLSPENINIFRTPITPIPITGPMLSATGSLDENNITAGAKRRHAVMMMLDSSEAPSTAFVDVSQSPAGGPGSSAVSQHVGAPSNTGASGRRRTRSGRYTASHHHHHHQGVQSGSVDSMDVEDDGRERKRVARR